MSKVNSFIIVRLCLFGRPSAEDPLLHVQRLQMTWPRQLLEIPIKSSDDHEVINEQLFRYQPSGGLFKNQPEITTPTTLGQVTVIVPNGQE